MTIENRLNIYLKGLKTMTGEKQLITKTIQMQNNRWYILNNNGFQHPDPEKQKIQSQLRLNLKNSKNNRKMRSVHNILDVDRLRSWYVYCAWDTLKEIEILCVINVKSDVNAFWE